MLMLVFTFAGMVILAASAADKANEHYNYNNKGNENENNADTALLPWQRCSVFVAPTVTSGQGKPMNWGVYANRDFSEGEIVDISPLTVPIPDGSMAVERSVLNDYVYGYWRVFQHPSIPGKHSVGKLYSILFGPDMFYNHHPVAPNVGFFTFGREPEEEIPDAVNPQGFVAIRNIRKGEELFSSYNGKEDGGAEWFRRRGIPMETPPALSSSAKHPPLLRNTDGILDKHSHQYCSKIYAGLGLPSWKGRLLPLLPKDYDLPFSIDPRWLAPSFDAGWGDAKTKVDIRAGERLEVSTALVLSHESTKDTALMPLVYAWEDLHEDHREGVRLLAAKGHLHVQYQGPDTSWKPRNNFTDSKFGDLVLFPVAGNIGMVRRLTGGGEEANCRLVVHPVQTETNNENDSMEWLEQPVGVTIELIATEDIVSGTVLVVDLVESVATKYEYQLLLHELKATGQPFAREVFANRRFPLKQDTEPPEGRTVTTTRSAGEEL